MTVSNQVQTKIEVRTKADMAAYFSAQPKHQPTFKTNPPPRATVNQPVAAANQESKEGESTLIGKQYSRDLGKMKLFYASIDGALVVISTFTKKFKIVIDKRRQRTTRKCYENPLLTTAKPVHSQGTT